MNGFRLLVCVDGSHAALEAARLAIRLVADHSGEVLAVSVLGVSDTARRLDAAGRDRLPAGQRLERSIRAVLERLAGMADDAGVTMVTDVLEGDPLRAILRRARAWTPDMVLIGRTGRSGPGSPMVGSLAMHLVEFAEWPVVVVPEGNAGTIDGPTR